MFCTEFYIYSLIIEQVIITLKLLCSKYNFRIISELTFIDCLCRPLFPMILHHLFQIMKVHYKQFAFSYIPLKSFEFYFVSAELRHKTLFLRLGYAHPGSCLGCLETSLRIDLDVSQGLASMSFTHLLLLPQCSSSISVCYCRSHLWALLSSSQDYFSLSFNCFVQE